MEDKISMDILNKVNTEIGKLFAKYQKEINKTFCADLSISINLPIKINIPRGSVEVRAGISFVESRVKDENVISIDQNQKQLFPADGGE